MLIKVCCYTSKIVPWMHSISLSFVFCSHMDETSASQSIFNMSYFEGVVNTAALLLIFADRHPIKFNTIIVNGFELDPSNSHNSTFDISSSVQKKISFFFLSFFVSLPSFLRLSMIHYIFFCKNLENVKRRHFRCRFSKSQYFHSLY